MVELVLFLFWYLSWYFTVLGVIDRVFSGVVTVARVATQIFLWVAAQSGRDLFLKNVKFMRNRVKQLN